jgi:hypothetical protein
MFDQIFERSDALGSHYDAASSVTTPQTTRALVVAAEGGAERG